MNRSEQQTDRVLTIVQFGGSGKRAEHRCTFCVVFPSNHYYRIRIGRVADFRLTRPIEPNDKKV
jgi:hypothetical protein